MAFLQTCKPCDEPTLRTKVGDPCPKCGSTELKYPPRAAGKSPYSRQPREDDTTNKSFFPVRTLGRLRRWFRR